AFTPTENDFPHLGAQIAFGQLPAFGRTRLPSVPTAVSLPDPVTDGPYTTPGQNGGFLGAGYAPFRVLGDPNEADFRVDGLADEPERLTEREALRQQLDRGHLRLASHPGPLGLDRYRQRALALLRSGPTRRAFVRGLLESTLVLAMGEFGRTPRFGQCTGNGVNETGRDHWAACYSIVVAGGKAGGGRVLGKSDRIAAYPAADPYPPEDVQATVLHALGVDPLRTVRDAFGRDVPLSAGTVRKALFGVQG